MKKIILMLMLMLAGCAIHQKEEAEKKPMENEENVTKNTTEDEKEIHDMEEKELKLQLTVNGKTYEVSMADNESSKALMERLPMTLHMSPLNGNEKYYYLDESLPAEPFVPSSIHTGDLMLFGSDCIVLFYDDFTTSYSYTPLGHLKDAGDLAEVVGSGSVEVDFER